MICRVCLKKSECCLKIFDINGEKLGIADILKQHFWFQPIPNDSISTVICRICWMKVNDFHEFYQAVEQAHSALSGDYLKNESMIVYTGKEFVDTDIKVKEELTEAPCTADMSSSQQVAEALNPLCDLNSECSEACLENASEYILHAENEVSDAVAERSLQKCTTRRKRKYEGRIRAKHRKVEENAPTNGTKVQSENGDSTKRKRSCPKRTPQDVEMVKKHIPMGCEFCTFVSEDFVSISKHFRVQHPNVKPYVRCCNKKLFDRLQIVQHAYKHDDPEFFKCQECQKVFSDKYTLRSHVISTHAPDENLNFSCDQCPKKFLRKHLLELHRASHVPMNERTFKCDQCPNSRFASDQLLKMHITMRHRRATNVCHVCAKEIRDKSAFEKHVRLHFEDSGPRVKCPLPGCDRWLKDEDNLRQHMRRQHNREEKVFTCDECGRECKNRRALSSHKRWVHSNEVFTCEECNKSFKKAITLREHMATHTGESLYKCPFCTRTFNCSANMHSHKKKMHPIEWDVWRKTKHNSSQYVISLHQDRL